MNPPVRYLLALLATLLVACSDDSSQSEDVTSGQLPEALRPTLSFYHIPNCFLCQELTNTLNELEREHGRTIHFRTVDYHLPASQERLHKNQLGSHGIIISDAQGGDLWSLKAHVQGKDELIAAVERLATK